MLLEVQSLSISFGGVLAVENCSFAVDSKEAVGLIGANGAGKSTVISLISGFARPDTGAIRFDGMDLTRRPAHVRARLGLIRTFQLARVWGRMTVMENMLVAGADSKREKFWRQFVPGRRAAEVDANDRARAREILADFDLLKLKDAPAQQLSGGQKRLLEFARIMMARPRMALLDEPSASLSPVMSDRIGGSIEQLTRTGIAVLLIEHDTALVEATCTRVLCMSAGRIIAEGSMQTLRRNELVIESYLGTVLQVGGEAHTIRAL